MAVGGIARLFRVFAQAVIRAGVREGLNGQQILDGIKGEVGRAYRRQNFYVDYRQHLLEFQRSQALSALDLDAHVTRDLITDAPPRGGFNYEYRFHIAGLDRRTGEAVDRYASVGSDELITKGQALDEFNASIDMGGYYADQLQIEEVSLDAIYSEG